MVGIDEVGRGCLAGPLLVVAARQKSKLPPGLKDSKLLSRAQRQDLYKSLIIICDWGQGWVSASEINRLGLAKCLKLGVRRAIADLQVDLDEQIIMDGIVNYVPTRFQNARTEAKADNNYEIVSAASILAKVTRDSYMQQLAKRHPKYNFGQHVGYGTPEHYRLLAKYGPIKNVHRMAFAPLAKLQTKTAL